MLVLVVLFIQNIFLYAESTISSLMSAIQYRVFGKERYSHMRKLYGKINEKLLQKIHIYSKHFFEMKRFSNFFYFNQYFL